LRRKRKGSKFVYLSAEGKVVRDAASLERIRKLVIPPAWTDVWICTDPRGHLQSTGRDVRGRKQHRYHPRWRQVRDETKYDRLIGFAQKLPAIRQRTAEDLGRVGLPREKVLATVVQLLEKTLIRVGNDEYAKQNRSYGLTTLRDTHVDVNGRRVRFTFKGKSGVEHEIALDDRRLARIVKQCRDLPGYDLFQYVDDEGGRQTIESADVNAYLRSVSGDDYSSKDFRTWAGTVLATELLRDLERFQTESEAKKQIVSAVDSVAKRLGNTKAVCRKCYIHPAVFEAFMDGSLIKARARVTRRIGALSEPEAAVLAMLQRRLRAATDRRAS
jgi:DNA topoisomerase-1